MGQQIVENEKRKEISVDNPYSKKQKNVGKFLNL